MSALWLPDGLCNSDPNSWLTRSHDGWYQFNAFFHKDANSERKADSVLVLCFCGWYPPCFESLRNTWWTMWSRDVCGCRWSIKLMLLFVYINKIQQDATVCRYLFTAKLLYMFRVSIVPIIRSTWNCTRSCSYSFMYSWWWVRWTPETYRVIFR